MAAITGQKAPDFTIYTTKARPWRLADQLGSPVVLLFFPGAFTSTCTTELNEVNNDLARYNQLGATVVGISTDSTPVLGEFKKVQHLDFELLSDHNASVAEQYGAKYDGGFTHMNLDRIAKRAAFVIDGTGVVRYAEVLEDADEHPDFESILAVLEQTNAPATS